MGGSGGFPPTRGSVVLATRSGEPEVRRHGYARLLEAYWKPVYKYLRVRWGAPAEDAEDLTQEFFARALEKGFLERYDASRALFRTYLRTCLDSFVANERKAASRLKRGGEVELVPLDFPGAEAELVRVEPRDGGDPEAYFHREWLRALFASAVDDLRLECEASGKSIAFDLFQRYDVEGPDPGERLTYGTLARELGVRETQVVNHLAWARRRLRELVLEHLRELCSSDEEFRSEARELFGASP